MTDSQTKIETGSGVGHIDGITPEDIEALRRGSHAVYDKIYLQYRKPIYNLLYKLTRSQAEAEDITQDVFITLWEYREKIDPGRNFKYYLQIVARRSAMKFFRHRKVKDGYVSSLSNREEAGASPSDEAVIEKEILLLKEIALERMPKQRRRIYEMCYDESMTNDQIAEKLGITKESVSNQLSIARRDVKKIISLMLLILLSS